MRIPHFTCFFSNWGMISKNSSTISPLEIGGFLSQESDHRFLTSPRRVSWQSHLLGTPRFLADKSDRNRLTLPETNSSNLKMDGWNLEY